MTQVLGISGSPVRNSNTDRAVKAVLDATGLETEFIKLSELHLEPCRACLGCKNNNQCVVRDDGQALAEKFRNAKAFVLGAFTPYSSLDGRSKAFMERMYCLRHQTGLNRGKIGAAVITTAVPPGAPNLPPAADIASQQVAFWMMEEGMENLGALVVLGNVPCLKCGHGDDCEMSGVKMMHGPAAEVADVPINQFENDDELVAEAKALGQRMRDAVLATPQTPLPVKA